MSINFPFQMNMRTAATAHSSRAPSTNPPHAPRTPRAAPHTKRQAQGLCIRPVPVPLGHPPREGGGQSASSSVTALPGQNAPPHLGSPSGQGPEPTPTQTPTLLFLAPSRTTTSVGSEGGGRSPGGQVRPARRW